MTTMYLGVGRFKTVTGTELDANDPRFATPSLSDTLRCLANICRFGGHLEVHYSVAHHSMFVGKILESAGCNREIIRAGYIHDFPEVITGDVIGPNKPLLGESLKRIETKWARHFEIVYGLEPESTESPKVKWADKIAFHVEDNILRGTPYPDHAFNWRGAYEKILADISKVPIDELVGDIAKEIRR